MNDFSRLRILVSNDDGITAPGLKVLERVARALSKDVWVVAPEQEQSGAGHSLTLRRPLRLRQVSRRRFAVDGTPTDCVLLAVNELLRKRPPHLVLSGVNRGANMGEDVTYSGTVAAAMEGTLLGLPAIALSLQTTWTHPPHWSTVEAHAPALIQRLCTAGWPQGVLMNLNFPDVTAAQVKGVQVTEQGYRKIGSHVHKGDDPYGRPYYWIGAVRSEEAPKPGTDLHAVHDGYISVSPIHLEMTHRATLSHLEAAFR